MDTGVLRHVVANVNCPEELSDADFFLALNAVAEEVDYIPRADVAPVVHSYWEHIISSDEENIGVCHNCKYPVSWFWGIAKYCPDCGAKMDGKGEGDAG